jgi:hypothetical protein
VPSDILASSYISEENSASIFREIESVSRRIVGKLTPPLQTNQKTSIRLNICFFKCFITLRFQLLLILY